jgi:rhodanese-related sulfurtransferase
MLVLGRMTAVVILAIVGSVLWNSYSGRGIPWIPRILEIESGPRLVLSGSMGGFLQYVDLAEARTRFDDGAVFVDSRETEDYAKGHIRGALHVSAHDPDDAIAATLNRLAKDAGYVVYCDGAECGSSTALARKMKDKGFPDVSVFYGGWQEWSEADLPVASGR